MCLHREFKRSHFPKEDLLRRRKLGALVTTCDVSVMPPTTAEGENSIAFTGEKVGCIDMLYYPFL